MINFIIIPLLVAALIACILSSLVDEIIVMISEKFKKNQLKKRLEGAEKLEKRRPFISAERL
ncbi:hypothetical protein BKP35_18215 [Anaerobacillus arseniciselenatis]|uniref:Uncharacterized protein n=1 Tax=Anaerobacillus arseniciselenatis TaxID=85682 RepID=A0A1S2L6M0_9BACI|nr:hypothetical protein [Anaerobacillus arseniciselenatis]OIJ07623.1 hypothetical protein BKP35_18215 [Anaerobacillus arseniciselenatis]